MRGSDPNIASNEGVSTLVTNYYHHIIMASQWEGSQSKIIPPPPLPFSAFNVT